MKKEVVYLGIILATSLFSLGCQDTRKKDASKSSNETFMPSSITSDSAANLLAVNCYVCHGRNSSSHEDLLAPPLAGIKKRYMNATGNREVFIERMTTFAFNPTKDAAMMKGPIKRFGLMPKTALKQSQIEAIVTYIYNNEIPAPSWFGAHEKQMHKGQQ
ncbi:Cytochrome c [Marivirga sericea]|uniref:Cytochrome c n=1 Tax=Marivirga sericea TaxID=1028 RepID=A0A1X7I4I6_9BACT|nr:c-type cytochrome [Marivirga sericea]SMG09111.1 Cytochrome c [Marivirga sericea]